MALVKWEVDSMIGARIFADIVDVASSWKVVLELMKGAGHDTICEIEGFLHPIAVMNINVYVEHALISFSNYRIASTQSLM